MAPRRLALLLMALLLGDAGAARDIWADYAHVPTSCEAPECVAGGCLFENCERPLSCAGGLCYFRAATFSVALRARNRSGCKDATCEGGACVFERVETAKCPGGACHFRKMQTTLVEGYCTGGGCRLDGHAHPTDFSATLSE